MGVGFVGGASFGVAWFPLGPREPFIPAYRVSNVYVQQVNITHVNVTNINVTNVRYVNQSVPGAVVAAPQSGFAGARPVASMARPVTMEQMRGAQVVGTATQIAPQRENVLGNARANAPAPQPPQALMTRPVAAKATPPPAPVSFAAKQAALQANPGRPVAPEQLQQIRTQQPRPVGGPVAPPAPMNRMDSRPPTAVRPPAPAAAPARSAPQQAPRPAPAAVAPRPAEAPRPAAESPKTEKKPAPKAKPKAEKEEKKP
jgi:hypothetical protein